MKKCESMFYVDIETSYTCKGKEEVAKKLNTKLENWANAMMKEGPFPLADIMDNLDYITGELGGHCYLGGEMLMDAPEGTLGLPAVEIESRHADFFLGIDLRLDMTETLKAAHSYIKDNY